MNKKKPVRTCERLLAVKVSNGFSFQITVDKSQITVATSDSMLDNSNALHRNDRTHQVDSSKDQVPACTFHSAGVDSHKVAPVARQKPPSSSKPPISDPVGTQKETNVAVSLRKHQCENVDKEARSVRGVLDASWGWIMEGESAL